MPSFIVNTSNPGKLEEYKRFLGSDSVSAIQKDLPEPDADPITIIRYKASQFENVLVDDVSLEVEGVEVGTNIRWLLDSLPQFVGRKARFVCLLAIHRQDQVEIYRASVEGSLVPPRGKSYGFNPFFQPDGSTKTFAEEKADRLNPRYLALQDFLQGRPWKRELPLKEWTAKFQADSN